MTDRRLIVGEFDPLDANNGKLFALAPNDATGVALPTFQVGTSRPRIGTTKGEGYYDTNQRQGFVWTGSAWQGIAPNPIMTYDTEAELTADNTPRLGTYATAGDTGSLFIKAPTGWRQVGVKQYPTAIDLFGDRDAAVGALGEVEDEGSLWEMTNTGWRLLIIRPMPDTDAIVAWNEMSDGANLGDRALDMAHDILYIRTNNGWQSTSIFEDTEVNIRATTWVINGQEAIATDTGRTFTRINDEWIEEPLQHYDTEAALLAANVPDGTMAWANDTSNIFARAAGSWIGTNTGFYDPLPIGTIAAYPTGVTPSGWLLCDGATIPTGTDYDTLRTVLGTTTVPDLRGQFLRGASSSTDTLLSKQQWTTGMPRSPFTATASNVGNHDHGLGDGNVVMTSLGGHDLSPAGGGNPEGYRTVRPDGAHTHTITVAGGDTETAPDHVKINWCIKAKFATLVPANSLRVNTTMAPVEGDMLTYDGTNATWRNKQWTSVGTTAPALPAKGFTWFDTNHDELQIYNGTKWVPASTPHWEADITMGANAGTVGNQIILARNMTPRNDGIYISIVDTELRHAGSRAAYAVHVFTTDSTGSAKMTGIHIHNTGTRFSKLHWYWKDNTDGYCLAATVSEACVGAVLRVGMMSPTARLDEVKADGNTLATDTTSGTTIDLLATGTIPGLSEAEVDAAVKASALRLFPGVSTPYVEGTPGTPGNTFNYVKWKPGTSHRWMIDVAGNGNWNPVMYLQSGAATAKTATHDGILYAGVDQFVLERSDSQGGVNHGYKLGWGDDNNTVNTGNVCIVQLDFYEATYRHIVVVHYTLNYRRKSSDMISRVDCLMYLTGQDSQPLNGNYTLNAFTGNVPYEIRQF